MDGLTEREEFAQLTTSLTSMLTNLCRVVLASPVSAAFNPVETLGLGEPCGSFAFICGARLRDSSARNAMFIEVEPQTSTHALSGGAEAVFRCFARFPASLGLCPGRGVS